MTQAYAENGHGIGCISAVNVIPHRSVSAALKPMMHNTLRVLARTNEDADPVKSPVKQQIPIAATTCGRGSGMPGEKTLTIAERVKAQSHQRSRVMAANRSLSGGK